SRASMDCSPPGRGELGSDGLEAIDGSFSGGQVLDAKPQAAKTNHPSSQAIATVNATPAAHAVAFAAVMAGGRRGGQRLGAAGAVRLAHLVDVLTLRTGDLRRDPPPLQVRLDLAGREIALVNVLGQVDLDQLVKPTLVRRDAAVALGQLRLQLAGRVKALRSLAGRQMV